MFQHTAAQRRLRRDCQVTGSDVEVSTHSRAEAAALNKDHIMTTYNVSTHSRAEAAAFYMAQSLYPSLRFNTQPRRGGCLIPYYAARALVLFQHTAAQRRLLLKKFKIKFLFLFQHTAAQRRLHDQRIEYCEEYEFQHTAAQRRLRN